MNRSLILLLAVTYLQIVTSYSASLAQSNPEPVPVKFWFVARVVAVEPFTLEYLDDAYRTHMRPYRFEFGVEVNRERSAKLCLHLKAEAI